ncbi:MAG TPA: glycosyltransferase family 4 protein [Mariprofundaceae bacterium]|nr:glycosyltransferase family 4 protein [Mariprofundaceae bacterium]
MTLKAFLKGHIAALQRQYDVSIVVNTNHPDSLREAGIEGRIYPLQIARAIALKQDLKGLLQLIGLFRKERFDIIQSVTPKAGLLAMLAGFLARIPVRVHIFTGQVWVTQKGFFRWLLRSADRLIAVCATHLLADSASQRDFLIDQGIVNPKKIRVLASGSICGVDVERFRPDPEKRALVRKELGIPEGDLVFLFVGRLTPDKGMFDLARAFCQLGQRCREARLLVVGPDECDLQAEMKRLCTSCVDRLHFVDYTEHPEQFMAAADLFCLPSYREGFGSSIIEAAASGIPAVASRIYGVTDAVVEEVTGLLHEPGDVDGLADCMLRFADSPEMRSRCGKAAYARACDEFSSVLVTDALVQYYRVLLP